MHDRRPMNACGPECLRRPSRLVLPGGLPRVCTRRAGTPPGRCWSTSRDPRETCIAPVSRRSSQPKSPVTWCTARRVTWPRGEQRWTL